MVKRSDLRSEIIEFKSHSGPYWLSNLDESFNLHEPHFTEVKMVTPLWRDVVRIK